MSRCPLRARGARSRRSAGAGGSRTGGEVRNPDVLPGVLLLELADDIACALDAQGPLAGFKQAADPAVADAEVKPEGVAVLFDH